MLDTDILVIGGSAAGLATAACLKEAGLSFEILEAGQAVGGAWRGHYDRLHLHTPKSGSSLPGLAMPADWPRYPARDQVVDYLERYRAHHGLEPRFGQNVKNLQRHGEGWVATTADREWRARQVVVATGYTRVPVRPEWEGQHDFHGPVLHSSEYRNGASFAGQTVLVVGFGNSACEIAIDLVEHDAKVHISARSPVNVLPRDVFGLVPILQIGIAMRHLPPGLADALAWPLVQATVGDITKLGLRKLPYGPNTQIARDRRIPHLDIGTLALIRAGRITVHDDVARFGDRTVEFDDRTRVAVDAVVLATGYRPALDDFLPEWRSVCDDEGAPLVSGGPTALPGLYFCGYFVSPAGMLREMGLEARRIAQHLAGR